jgi:type I site-specific restriction-modification system R (restriction) subunit
MGLNNDQIKKLLEQIIITRQREINCNEFLQTMGEFAERDLAGLPITDLLKQAEHHLQMCAECREEYEALIAVLKQKRGSLPDPPQKSD